MRNRLLLAAFVLASGTALADTVTLQPVAAATTAMAAQSADSGHMARMYQRYCDKLREGPEAYAAFVKRMATVTGYTFTDFQPAGQYDVVRYQCREASGVVARLDR